jgi:hypothetical protein
MQELEVKAPATPKRRITFGKRTTHKRPGFSFVSPPVLRMAAALALMVLVFTATPARAWLAQGWEALKSLVESEPTEFPEIEETPEEAPAELSSILRFTPRGTVFRLEFMEFQSGGSLVLQIDSTTSASAGILGEESDEEMILLPDGLRVRNSSESLTSYEVRLPHTLSIVEVSVSGNVLVRLDVQSQSIPISRELSLTEGLEN